MGWTKGQLVDAAFDELALAKDAFDLQDEERERALVKLDSMVAMWAAKGVRIGYNFPSSQASSSLNDDSGIPDSASETVYLNLAVRMAPSYGKQLSQDTRKNARDGYDVLLWTAAQPIEQQLPNTMPRGAGNKPWRRTDRPFLPKPDESPLQYDNQSGDLDILSE